MSYKEIAEIIKIIDASNCEELILDLPDAKIVVRRSSTRGDPAPAPVAPGVVAPQTQAPAAPPAASPASTPTAPCSDDKIEVRSPMVGTFYRTPAPNAPAFVEVGSMVKAGDPMCLIEVMKLFTTLTAEQEGRIAEILVGHGEGVQYDQVLFVIEAA
ncbi:MAG TPA: acetyl-CoA carboxylase biotin carboxyl carrier protein [Aestuariivirgaceae bacterium]|nr:acetyl-CoA carboxylase biotin carboxyl carrier protein [Aestuariivirgaceae bacterium]